VSLGGIDVCNLWPVIGQNLTTSIHLMLPIYVMYRIILGFEMVLADRNGMPASNWVSAEGLQLADSVVHAHSAHSIVLSVIIQQTTSRSKPLCKY
jgi:hypothetical protein